MKTLQFTIILLFSFTFVACPADGEEYSVCLQTKIDEFSAENESCERSSIKMYTFQNQELFAFAQGICISDGGTQVLLEDCTEYCFLGGIAGFQDCQGENFEDNAVLVKTIWTSE